MHFGYQRSDSKETGDAYLLGPLRGGSAFRKTALAYFDACHRAAGG